MSLKSLQALYDELKRTQVISQDFKNQITSLAQWVAQEATEEAEKRIKVFRKDTPRPKPLDFQSFLASIPQQPQSQESLLEQLRKTMALANKAGLYDAADHLLTRIRITKDSEGK